jgi:hypothetical protein
MKCLEEKNKRKTVRNVSNPLTQICWTCQAYKWLCIQTTRHRHSYSPEHEDYVDKDRCPQNPSHRSGKGCSCLLIFVYGKAMTWFLKSIPSSLPSWLFSSLPFFLLLISIYQYNLHLTLYLPRHMTSASKQEAAAHRARILMIPRPYAITPSCLHLRCVSMTTPVTTNVIET